MLSFKVNGVGDSGKSAYEKGGVGSNPPIVRVSGGWEHNCDNKRPLSSVKEEHMVLRALAASACWESLGT